MNPSTLSYRDLRKARSILKRKIKDKSKRARKAHGQTPIAWLMQIRGVTTAMLEIENKRRAA